MHSSLKILKNRWLWTSAGQTEIQHVYFISQTPLLLFLAVGIAPLLLHPGLLDPAV